MYDYVYVIVETRTICRVDVRAESRLEDEKKSRTKKTAVCVSTVFSRAVIWSVPSRSETPPRHIERAAVKRQEVPRARTRAAQPLDIAMRVTRATR